MRKVKFDKDTKNGMLVFFGYYFLKTLLFLLNVFVFYKWTKNEYSFIILSLVLNSIFFLLVNQERFYLLILGGVLAFTNSKGILNSISISFVLCNGVSYIIDLISFLFNTLIMNLLFKLSKLK